MQNCYQFQFQYKILNWDSEDKSPGNKYDIPRPCIMALLKGSNDRKLIQPFLLDSGADRIFIKHDLAKLLGLRLSGNKKTITTAGNPIKVFESSIDISLVQGDGSFNLGDKVYCYVFDEEKRNIPNIMGRLPLFDEFKVTFEQYKKFTTLTYRGHIFTRTKNKARKINK